MGLAACASDSAPAPDLASDTASLPSTEIAFAALAFDDGAPTLGKPRNITQHDGYDNQPSFVRDNSALYYVSEGASGKTDVWRYDIAQDSAVRVYASPTVSEYSPKELPAGYRVSYIQENETADVTRVHAAPAAGGAGAPVIDLAPLGYYAWLQGGKTLAVYLRSEPARLQLVDVATGAVEDIASTIGRSLQHGPGGARLYFTIMDDEDNHRLHVYDLETRSVTPLVALPEATQDYAVVFDETGAAQGVFAGDGSVLQYAMIGGDDQGWRPVRDFAPDRLAKLSRIAVSGDHQWIAVVGEPAQDQAPGDQPSDASSKPSN
ncbi:MAG: TolB-like translocation protein [Hyphococcus sp.]